MELSNGHKLQNGKYRIERKIGQGGFGITYLARCYEKIQSAMGSASGFYTIVIKEFFWSRYCSRDADGFSVSISSTEGVMLMSQFKRKLKKEGEIISKLSHPNIVGILDIFEENNTAYLVMQYIEGESLNDIIRKTGKIDETTALNYTEQICSALTKIHSKRVLHLDIKPSNILIDEDNQVKLIDFGISKQYDESEHETSNTPIGISAGYSPIEQYGTLKSFLPPTDIYSAGATLYKMLTGQTPIAATTRSEYDLEPVRNFSPNVSKNTEAAVAKAMSEKVRDRFQTAQDFLQALTSIKPEEKEDKIITETIAVESKTVIETDNTSIERQPDKPKPIDKQPDKPKPASQPVKPLIKSPEQSVSQSEKISKPKQTPIIDPDIFNRWKKFLPAAVIIAAVIIFFVIFLNRNSGTKMTENKVKTEQPTTVEEETKTNVTEGQTNSGAQMPNAQNDAEREQKERIEREAKAKQDAERLRKAKEEQDKLEADRLQLEREAKAKQEAEQKRKEKEEQDKRDAANFLQQANSAFKNSSLGTARLDQSFQLYMKAKEKGADVTEGYNNFMSVAQALIGGGAGFDANVKKLLEYAQKLNNTQEVRALLEKYK